MRVRRGQVLFIAVFLGPALVLFTAFVAWPGVRALVYSLQKWDGLSEPEWVGLANFRTLFEEDGLFLAALGHNLYLMLAAGSLTLALSLFFATVLHRRIRGTALFRVAFFFPNIIASIAVALLWILLYSTTDFGVFNGFLLRIAPLLEAVGWQGAGEVFPFPFTESRYLVTAIIPMMVWTATGFYMVLFLAAMENIPESYYEAAVLDGAAPWAQFRYITLPLIREVLVVGIVFFIIASVKTFDAIWLMENQYPTKESHVLATVLYQKVFTEYNVGYGSAVAVMLFILVFCATLVTLRLSRREAVEY